MQFGGPGRKMQLVWVLVEGILTFYYANMRNMFDLKLFVDTDADIRLAR